MGTALRTVVRTHTHENKEELVQHLPLTPPGDTQSRWDHVTKTRCRPSLGSVSPRGRDLLIEEDGAERCGSSKLTPDLLI